jgi:hypothetical protein
VLVHLPAQVSALLVALAPALVCALVCALLVVCALAQVRYPPALAYLLVQVHPLPALSR